MDEPNFVNVLVDGYERLGELSYVVPNGLLAQIGDAVEVPFGKRVARGLVTGAGDPSKATRDIIGVYGRRSDEVDIAVARDLASANLCEFTTVAKRLAPTTKRGNPPLDAGVLLLREGDDFEALGRSVKLSERPRRIEAVAPGVNMYRLAALEAVDLATNGQVLVLCPTKDVVAKVCAEFESGAARLYGIPKKDEPSAWAGFVIGTVRVGVATRTSALWAAKELVGVVVVDEDHPGHREATMPYTSARDVAAKRTRSRGIGLVLLSTNPSPAGLGSGVKISVVGREWPRTKIASRSPRRRFAPEMPKGLARVIEDSREKGLEVMVVSGVSRSRRRCVSCKVTWECKECRSGSCVHCSEVCPECSSEDTLVMGWDQVKSARVSGVERVVLPSDIHSAQVADLIILIDVDPWLEMAELVPGRVASDRILAAASRVSPGGELVIVTCEPTNELLVQLARGDLLGVAKRTWEQAKSGALPPFGRQITVSGVGRAPTTALWPGRVLGPRTQEDGGWEIVVLLRTGELESMRPVLDRLRRRGKVRVTVL